MKLTLLPTMMWRDMMIAPFLIWLRSPTASQLSASAKTASHDQSGRRPMKQASEATLSMGGCSRVRSILLVHGNTRERACPLLHRGLPRLFEGIVRRPCRYRSGLTSVQSRSSTMAGRLAAAATRVPILSQRRVTCSCLEVPFAAVIPSFVSHAVTSQESPDSCSAAPSAIPAFSTVPLISTIAPPIFCVRAPALVWKSRCSASAVVLYTGRDVSEGGAGLGV